MTRNMTKMERIEKWIGDKVRLMNRRDVNLPISNAYLHVPHGLTKGEIENIVGMNKEMTFLKLSIEYAIAEKSKNDTITYDPVGSGASGCYVKMSPQIAGKIAYERCTPILQLVPIITTLSMYGLLGTEGILRGLIVSGIISGGLYAKHYFEKPVYSVDKY